MCADPFLDTQADSNFDSSFYWNKAKPYEIRTFHRCSTQDKNPSRKLKLDQTLEYVLEHS